MVKMLLVKMLSKPPHLSCHSRCSVPGLATLVHLPSLSLSTFDSSAWIEKPSNRNRLLDQLPCKITSGRCHPLAPPPLLVPPSDSMLSSCHQLSSEGKPMPLH